MGKETPGGHTEGEGFVVNRQVVEGSGESDDLLIDTETDPDKELVRVLNTKGKPVEITRATKRTIDIKNGVIGSSLDRIAVLQKEIAVKDFFAGVSKVQDFRAVEKKAIDNLEEALKAGSGKEKEAAKLILGNIEIWINKLKDIYSRPDSDIIPADIKEELYNVFDEGKGEGEIRWVKKEDYDTATMKDLKGVIVKYVTHLYDLLGDYGERIYNLRDSEVIQKTSPAFIVERGWLVTPKVKQ